MKANRNEPKRVLALCTLIFASAALAQSTAPTITNVRVEGTNCVVTVNIPEGVQRITLETSDRANRQSWAPRAVVRPESRPGVATFRLPMSHPMELIRVRADATEVLPASFYLGTNVFSAPSDSSLTRNSFVGVYGTDGGGGTPTSGGGDSARAVVESDIWKLQGNTLYFFNQYRGLQIIDITDPDLAFVRGTFKLPAVGEQMYLLENNRVVLLAADGCNYNQSQVWVVADTNGSPQAVARLLLPGTILESRLVGTALYVASQVSRPVPGTTNMVWEWGTQVSAFDLSDPDKPVERNTLWYPGYGNVVSATDTYLFVVTQSPVNFYQSIVNLVDITDPWGTMAAHGSITNRGRVPDKFKLNYSDAVLAAISEDRSGTNGVRLVTRLETFHLSDPRSADPLGIVKLGELELGHGEQLHATRFDGNRVYVVTFFRIDPLWVVDFSNASAPKIAGSVEVPGWSTYIQPLGDRLVTLGVETNRVSVSLYDVADPAAPARLSLVTLGTHYSWSEANYDEKAFTLLTDAGLMLVPFSGDTTNGYASALQLIDYSRAELRARGQVVSDSGLSYRRATVHRDRVLSLSGWELASVDASDRDNPVIRGRLALAESVNRLLLAGNYVVQLSTGDWWDATTPVVSVATTSEPDRVLNRLALPSLPLLGATLNGDWLYLAQGTSGSGTSTAAEAKFVLSVISVPNLPTLTIAGQIATNTGPLGWSRDWQALWLKPEVLVWAGGPDYWWWCDFCPMVLGGGFVGGPGSYWPPYGSQRGGNGRLIAFDTSHPQAPQLAGQVDLTGTNRYGFSGVSSAGELVFLSHQKSAFVPDPGQTNSGKWVYRSYLDVVDFADPADPLVREPVNIPNSLLGVAKSGTLLYTLGYHWNNDPNSQWREYLEASAYDGVAAHLVDSMPLPTEWPRPALVVGDYVLVGYPGNGSTNVVPPRIATWGISDSGKFTLAGLVAISAPVNDLAVLHDLLAATAADSTVSLFEPADPAVLRPVGAGQLPLCWWWPDMGHSDGNLDSGLWVPLGAYGVTHIPTGP